ncbi:MAG: hypothetical protein J3K34DRAFT_403744 [Monoraphidium minutum]|nr:MAG: hypothetical protein J3K34DRAFT_403744 [Monoraphidium minutum]
MGVVLLGATAVFEAARALGAEPLLACVAAGAVAANRRCGRDTPNDVSSLVESVMYWTNIAFFGLAGASLKLNALAGTLWAALLVVAARLLAIVIGSHLGCHAGGVRAEHRRVFWMSQITQAGVALGLSRIAGTAFPEWGASFQALMTGIILVNLSLGPPFFRAALIRVGEARSLLALPLKAAQSGAAPPAAGAGRRACPRPRTTRRCPAARSAAPAAAASWIARRRPAAPAAAATRASDGGARGRAAPQGGPRSGPCPLPPQGRSASAGRARPHSALLPFLRACPNSLYCKPPCAPARRPAGARPRPSNT